MSEYKIKTFEEITTKMLEWVRANTNKLSDFSIGSKSRTILEAVAISFEELYQSIWKRLKEVIEENIYIAFDFGLLSAKSATGNVTFYRATPAPTNYPILAGTYVSTEKTDTADEIRFLTTQTVVLPEGATQISVPVQAERAGKVGNVIESKIVKFVSKPVGVDGVTNTDSFVDGRDLETKDERKRRFKGFISSKFKATLPALTYGALETGGVTGAKVMDNPYLYGLRYDGGYANISTELNDPFSAENAILLPEALKVGDALYLGAESKFTSLICRFSIAGVGSAGVWEYFDGNVWQNLTITDTTNGLTTDGIMSFTAPLDWRDLKIEDIWGFWLRFRITSAGFTTIPRAQFIFASPPPGIVEVYVQDINGEASEALLQATALKLVDYRGAGITINVKAPTKITQNVGINIRVNPSYNRLEVIEQVKIAVVDYFNQLTIGQSLYVSDLVNVVRAVEGGKAILGVELLEPSADVLASSGDIIRTGLENITVTVVN